ncbi:hypothetical protein [Engelhardtia mirabilis]|uniref:Uncharacterized protein n=1 Tax=Engelhardtia mirabilis TaxID=2528011 RepID=A0A518BM58_9BACT|nr:hypothetical protein Pla133_31610 [Planctomycetes bacterium Pla133]QDV02394.1 hypothetical protein Pla86_31600 [Planctomycetes bacterium Pla86]
MLAVLLASPLVSSTARAAAQELEIGPPTGIEWPSEGRVSAAFAALPPGEAGVSPSLAWPPVDAAPGAWTDGGPWSDWAEAVAAERDGDQPDVARRERLCLTALRQGRHGDAWRHAAVVARQDPDRGRALLARLQPGAPAGTAVLGDGRLEPLPMGVLLEPSLAPPTDPGPNRLDIREVVVHGLRIGEGVVGLKVGVRGDGVELQIEHEGGAPVELSVRVPCPIGFRTRVEYANWEKLPTIGESIPVRVEAGGEAFRVWARNELDPTPWPAATPATFDSRLTHSGLLLVVAPGDPAAAELGGLATAFSRLLGVACSTVTDPRAPAAGVTAPLRVDLTDPASRGPRLAALTGAVEHFALERGEGAR